MYENNYLEINLDILKSNAEKIVNKYNEYEYKIAMVKGNALGHGQYIVNTLIESGFNYLSVSSLNEAINIRKYNESINILCTEPIDLKYLNEIIKYNITITVHNLNYLKQLISLLTSKIKIHFKIDSGMNRLGFNTKEEFDEAMKVLNETTELEGIYSHFATPGIIDKNWDNQVEKFKNIISEVDISKIKIIHFASSFSLLSHPKIDICNGFRIGSAIYGINTYPQYSNKIKDKLRVIRNKHYQKKYDISTTYCNVEIDLNTFISLYSKVIEIKEVKPGEYIGYGTSYKTNQNIKVGIVDIGYEDGIGRSINNRKVYINNKYYEVLDICMCMMIVKIDEDVKINDKVMLIGENLKINNMANWKNETVHEVFLSLSKLPKKYIKNNEVVYSTYYKEEGC